MTTTTTPNLTNRPRTVLGSLTTTFTPPASCAYNVWVGNLDNPFTAWRGMVCEADQVNKMVPAVACWPSTTQGAVYPSLRFNGWGFYSPGTICPTGYSSACTATASGAADWNVQFSMLPGETAVGCCPTGFDCYNPINQPGDKGQTCTRTYSETSITTALCSFNGAGTVGTMVPGLGTYPLTWTQTTTTHSSATVETAVITALLVSAPMIQIAWQSSDLVAQTSSGSGSSSIPTSTATSNAGATASPTSSSSSSSSSSSHAGVSTSTLVGAIVGTAAAVGIIFAAAFLIWRRKRRGGGGVAEQHMQQQQQQSPLPPELDRSQRAQLESKPGGYQPEYNNINNNNNYWRNDLQANQYQELPGTTNAYELPDMNYHLPPAHISEAPVPAYSRS